MTLSDEELQQILTTPEALTVLVDYHSQQEAMADAMDYVESADFHKQRREAFERLRTDAEAARAKRTAAPEAEKRVKNHG